jgi:hypothetical protein
VCDGAIADRGVFNLMVHSNFTPIALKSPAFPGALVPDKSFNGVTDWFEAGPLYRISAALRTSISRRGRELLTICLQHGQSP